MIFSRNPEQGRKFLFFLFDAFCLGLALFISLRIRFGIDWLTYFHKNIFSLLGFIFFNLIFIYIVGLYELNSLQPQKKLVRLVFTALILAGVSNFVFSYVQLKTPAGRGVLILLMFTDAFLIWGNRFLYLRFFMTESFAINLFLFAEDRFSRELSETIKKNPLTTYRVKIISRDNFNNSIKNISSAAVALRAEVSSKELNKELRFSRFKGLEIYDAVQLYEEITGEPPIDFVDERYLFNASLKLVYALNRPKV